MSLPCADRLRRLYRAASRLERDALVFTTLAEGRAGRRLYDVDWRRQTWWPAVDNACHFEANGEFRLVARSCSWA
ncbi:hypothetical protein [Streptomyces sp. NPDC059008]|uniref:hypothetical protein n=1 Tax=Streptomyces sp. NPDC059008 TaxID=3346693 RepID=UPI0036AB0973